MSNTTRQPGRHFLQIPGPTPVPERIIQAMARTIIDHRSQAFADLSLRVINGIKTIFKTKQPVILYPSSGTGAWEAALVNTLSPGDKVLMVETGQFATLWKDMAAKIGLVPEFLPTDWRTGAEADAIESALKRDTAHEIKAVCVVHNETATGCRSWIQDIRKALDAAGHPALLMVDTISSLGCLDYRHDEWGVDVSISGSQKGLMLPPGLSFTAVSEKALEAAKSASLQRSYWSWQDMIVSNASGFFPFTPATGLLYGLETAITMLHEEGLDNVFARHERHGRATRAAVETWGLEVLCRDPKYYSPAVTSVLMPEGHNADTFRALVLENFNMSLGTGLNRLSGKVFRIGHLGDTNDLTIMGALSGVEMGLELAGVPHAKGGVTAAMAEITRATNQVRAAA
ncbi:alanine-glyoxylate transaminase / serine-glyoxylate transaminase / serine-pyruvate transaminase [Filomicrobium insigne]|uniref:Alanine-glyoxylate transaminase / serine-glyoxylate transaminase / serine-pyruvate transaminase n=1 Tax=Filomicrobium insigne TaxID=418854 RepID=A0A1H0MEU5_9HYPH|nr:aminotransferase class V-fold PLP-dependent enzyme [Filomicrobium insigne]SDO78963.1 alanine-glyoxylate transaminase / serine-glyoxylate transaminase / serine-pyruvate transaminase [Filomicrobium insigne]